MRPKSPALLSAVLTACACAVVPKLSAQTPALDACSVLTRDEIKTLSGKDPGAPDPSGSGDTTHCRWQEGSLPRGRVSLYAAVDPKEPKGLALKQLRDRGMNARAVDLGDDAVFLEDDDDTPSGTVFVRVGHWRVVIYIGAELPATAASTLPTLTALANAAVPKLRRAG